MPTPQAHILVVDDEPIIRESLAELLAQEGFAVTAYGSVESAVAAFQRGAHDYLMKPILLDEVLAKIRRLLEYRKLSLDNQWLRRELNRTEAASLVVGHSIAMKRLMDIVRKVAP